MIILLLCHPAPFSDGLLAYQARAAYLLVILRHPEGVTRGSTGNGLSDRFVRCFETRDAPAEFGMTKEKRIFINYSEHNAAQEKEKSNA